MTMASYPSPGKLKIREILTSDLIPQYVSAYAVFMVTLLVYMLTADSDASFWDCPEYITCASRLEVGHPPGNPIWMLAMRTLLLPFQPELHAFVVNLASGFMTALASYFLTRLCYVAASIVTRSTGYRAIAAAVSGGLVFAFCDSVWFSAVEAEVYAMSAFLSLFSLWLTVKWFVCDDGARQTRLLILIAYIMGLSLGVHQLNLLIIPVIALAICYRINPSGLSFIKSAGAICIGFACVALILFGIMNGTLRLAQRVEIWAVNDFGLPMFSGVIVYLVLLILILSATPVLVQSVRKDWIPTALYPLLLLSGIFYFGSHGGASAIISAVVAILIPIMPGITRKAIVTSAWSIGFIILGYSSFALILIRGYASPTMNEGTPTDIFALGSYISRDQYGSTPLLYGSTPYSRPLVAEDFRNDSGMPEYSRFVVEKVKERYVPKFPEAKLRNRSGLMTGADSSSNRRIISSEKEGYLLADYSFRRVMTPELDMWLPRITSSAPAHLESYADWAGMETGNMTRLEVSATLDSLGNPAGKLNPDGKRVREVSYRPTYLQNLRYFLTYQVGYMYLRYLGWNFIGRQNDVPSTGEIEHGNVITGFPFIDSKMLGDGNLLPPSLTVSNKGRNVYYGIPFILGIIGIVALCRRGRTGRRTLALTTLLFLMTGLAIVVYLNQTPGEPRERDYSFLVSYAAFSIWIACGTGAMMNLILRIHTRFSRKGSISGKALVTALGITLAAVCPLMLLQQNFDDHDRSGRGEPLKLAAEVLSEDTPSIFFTQGDNYTFPLWYTQETLGIGKRHTVIDVSYLALPDYVLNLMRQGDIRFTASPGDIAYGAFSFTKVSPEADTVPVTLMTALRELYADTTATPQFRHSKVIIPATCSRDSVVVNLYEFGRNISFKQLMLLDILASNTGTEGRKPLRFLNRMRSDFYRPLLPAMRRDTYSFVYGPALYEDMLDNIVAPLPLEASYIDPVTEEMLRQRRGELILTAKRLYADNPLLSGRILDILYSTYPYGTVPAGYFSVGDTLYFDALEQGELHYRLGVSTISPKDILRARIITGEAISIGENLRNYLNSLPPERRGTMSDESRRHIAIIPRLRSVKSMADSVCEEVIRKKRAQDPLHINH
ncbi:MAG: DUF2723 domain-containing protein [Muribaculaceae bacterium]|nr:DUF2723 domain-containing protein [Muribaculaceae bacterium]